MKRYRTIVADPPWEYERTGVTFRDRDSGAFTESTTPYQALSVDEIGALPVSELAEANAHLYLWTTQRYLHDAYHIAKRWGFGVSCVLVWCKQPTGFNVGGTFMSTVEFCLFCRCGSLRASQRIRRQWFGWRRGPHSAKPEAFIDMVEQVSPGPYLEMFARRQRLGWDTWGNECFDSLTGSNGSSPFGGSGVESGT